MKTDATCLYCCLNKDARAVYESDFVTVMLHPENYVQGELLVISRDHAATLGEMLDLEVHAVMETSIALARAVREATACKGIRLEQVEQDVHYHVRLIPLFNKQDHFYIKDADAYIEAIQAALFVGVK